MDVDSITIIAKIFDLIDENKSLTSIHKNDMHILEESRNLTQKYYNSIMAYRSFRHDIENYILNHDSGKSTDSDFINDIKRAFKCLGGCDEDYFKVIGGKNESI